MKTIRSGASSGGGQGLMGLLLLLFLQVEASLEAADLVQQGDSIEVVDLVLKYHGRETV
jgi:pantothenate kinase